MSMITTDNLCFIHIPKTAGSSVRECLEKKKDNTYEKKQLYDRHPTWKDILNVVGKEKYDELYKFCIIRNPVELFISWYNYVQRFDMPQDALRPIIKQQHQSIEYVIDWIIDNNYQSGMFPQHRWIYDNGKLMINKVFRYENLDEVKDFLTKRGYGELPHKNGSIGKPILTQEYRNKMVLIDKEDFDIFNYQP